VLSNRTQWPVYRDLKNVNDYIFRLYIYVYRSAYIYILICKTWLLWYDVYRLDFCYRWRNSGEVFWRVLYSWLTTVASSSKILTCKIHEIYYSPHAKYHYPLHCLAYVTNVVVTRLPLSYTHTGILYVLYTLFNSYLYVGTVCVCVCTLISDPSFLYLLCWRGKTSNSIGDSNIIHIHIYEIVSLHAPPDPIYNGIFLFITVALR